MTNLFIGIMSGTSMDGIDVVIFDASNHSVVNSINLPFPDQLHQDLTAIIEQPQTTLSNLGYLDIELAELYASAVNQLLQSSDLKASDITAIGCHGQTIFHQPDGQHRFSLQLGSGSYLAEKTSITTITDFRNRDMAAGGQGAPLVPAFHQAAFSDENKSRLIINIGGISNCSWLPIEGNTTGFDIGPGNTLMDCWINRHRNKSYDQDGQWAKSGITSETLLTAMLQDDYFHKLPPKSTGREHFNLAWLDKMLLKHPSLSHEDVQASLLDLTAKTISDCINRFNPDELFICGGGVHNQQLMNNISELSNVALSDIKSLGIAPDLVEASAFAWLAKQCINHQSGTLPRVTGATHSVISGAIYLV